MNASLFLGIASVVTLVCIGVYLGRLRPSLVRLQLTFSPQAFHRVVGRWSADQQRRVRKHYAADYVLIALYSACGWSLWASLSPLGAAGLCLPMAGLADVVENLLHQRFLSPTPPMSPWLYRLAGAAASVKWVFLVLFGACAARAALS